MQYDKDNPQIYPTKAGFYNVQIRHSNITYRVFWNNKNKSFGGYIYGRSFNDLIINYE